MVTFIAILLAGYRTTILALAPLALAAFLGRLTMSVRRAQRGTLAVTAAVAAVLHFSFAALLYSESLVGLSYFLAASAALINQPSDFDILVRSVLDRKELG